MELIPTFVHVTGPVSPTPSVIPPTYVVDPASYSVVAVVVPVLAVVLFAGITAIIIYMYIVAPITC